MMKNEEGEELISQTLTCMSWCIKKTEEMGIAVQVVPMHTTALYNYFGKWRPGNVSMKCVVLNLQTNNIVKHVK